MATDQEVRVTITTVGNVAGAQQVAQSLTQIQQVALQTQQATQQLASQLQQAGKVSIQIDPAGFQQLQNALAQVRQSAEQIAQIKIETLADPRGAEQVAGALEQVHAAAEQVARIGIQTSADPRGVQDVQAALTQLEQAAQAVKQIDIKTVGEPAGAKAVTDGLRDVQEVARQTQGVVQSAIQQAQQTTEQAQAGTESVADKLMRGLMASGPQTAQAFEENVAALKKTIGRSASDLTLVPADFGIQTAQDIAKGAQDAATRAKPAVTQAMADLQKAAQPPPVQAAPGPPRPPTPAQAAPAGPVGGPPPQPAPTQAAAGARALTAGADAATTAAKNASAAIGEVGEVAGIADTSLARFGAGLLGASLGLSLFATAGKLVHDAIADAVTQTVGLDAVIRSNTIALGQSARGFQDWARIVSEQAGVAESALLRAGTAAQILSRQAVLGPDSMRSLTAMAVALHDIQGIDVGQAMGQLTSALQGNQEAAAALNLNLDDSFVAFTQLGGVAPEVFRALDSGTQTALRFASAQDQVNRNLAATPITPVQQLQAAQSKLNAEWEKFTTTIGPGVVGALADILTAASNAMTAIGHLNELSVERNKQPGASDEGFKNEQAAAQQFLNWWQNTLGPGFEAGGTQARKNIDLIGQGVQALNDKVRDASGVDVIKEIGDANDRTGAQVRSNLDLIGQGFDQFGQHARDAADAVTSSWTTAAQAIAVADQADRQRASRVSQATQQLVDQGAFAALNAARQNQVTAQEELYRLQGQSLELTIQEAQVRVSMLPAQERMAELQNEANQAQLEATQRTLPSTRALEDLQLQIQRQRIIAGNPNESIETRTEAARTGASLFRQTPDAELRAIDARIAALPANRAAEDVNRQAQLQGLQQQQAILGLDYSRQQVGFLQQIAEAVSAQAVRAAAQISQVINVTLQTAEPGITEDDINKIASMATDGVISGFHSAVTLVNQRASSQLLGAGAGP